MSASSRQNFHAFLNLPYDAQHEQVYLAFVAGLAAFGLVPRTTLELGSSKRRLDRILSLIGRCRYSFHDLSRVELDPNPPQTPRFNMPFELGLAVAQAKARHHRWFVFEAVNHRLKRSLSDLDGTDPHIHDGLPEDVLRALGNALSRSARPTPADLKSIYLALKQSAIAVKNDRGGSLFEAGAFRDLVLIARKLARKRLTSSRDAP